MEAGCSFSTFPSSMINLCRLRILRYLRGPSSTGNTYQLILANKAIETTVSAITCTFQEVAQASISRVANKPEIFRKALSMLGFSV